MSHEPNGSILAGVGAMLDDVEQLYKDVHRHPELSMKEERTAALAADRLNAAGFDVTTGVGTTGVVGLLRNGDGPTVMLRADMDALPVQEQTGLDYASTTDGVMHACGHDMHVAWLAGAAALFAGARDDSWRCSSQRRRPRKVRRQ
jgi:amidohydrolase